MPTKVHLIMGKPGSGKGTQADMLCKKRNAVRISTGDLMRAEIQRETSLGREIEGILREGGLVPDNITVRLLNQRTSKPDCSGEIVLDGFPRNVAQVETLRELLAEWNTEFGWIFYVMADDQRIIDRITGRRTCSQCQTAYHLTNNPPKSEGVCDRCGGELVQRPDSTEEVVRRRLQVFADETLPAIEALKKESSYVEIDGNVPIEEVSAQILESIGQHA